MIQTAIIYTLLWGILFVALKSVESNNDNCLKEQTQFWTFGVVLTLIFVCLVKGLSEDMGTDYYSYAEAYNRIAHSSSLDRDYEIGYIYLNKTLALFGLNLPWIFVVNSFIVFFSLFFFASIIKENIAFAVVLWIFSFYIQSNNLWRQYDAMGFMLISLGFLIKTCDTRKIQTRNYLLSAIFAYIAFLFHTTSLVYILLFYGLWMIRERKISVWIIIGLITVSFLYTQIFVERSNLVSRLSTIGLLGYEDVYTIYDKFEEYHAHSAMSEYKDFILRVITICIGDYILKKNSSDKLRFIFYIVSFYFILYPFVRYHSLIMRILMYAQMLLPFYYGMVYYSLRQEKSKTMKSTIFLLAIFIIAIDYTVDFYNVIGSSTETLGHGYKLFGM